MKTQIRLWFIRETELACLYFTIPPERNPSIFSDVIWIPKSIIEHRTKRGDDHVVTLPDWFIRENEL